MFSSIIPAPYRLIAQIVAVALIAGALVAFGYTKGQASVQRSWDKEKLAIAEASRKATEQTRYTEHEWQVKYQGAIDERTKTEEQLADARAALSAADNRLHLATSDFQRRLSQAPVDAARSAASAAASLLSECSDRYEQVAKAADGHLADLRQCEAAWPR